MGVTKKAKVMFTCEHETKSDLEAWAKSERRTVSNLVEGVVVAALANWKESVSTDAIAKNKSND
ncbi:MULTISPECIES: hypothetical protein [Nostoc]|jgi:hypothetical protein|uniref:CopG-like ribbon-helix-helix domain-containing protein n=3 Tax=Nostoc TaxID=1177 RepID=A0A2R5FZ90_NOSCO|nr:MULTISPECIES: hypothetical protein [Nostoc]BBD70941.1 hypothetical protein NIES4070_73520 [Nostoc commune HK-02]MBD2247331.1 hypothetical protein [Nostoc sp. FACHB-888]MBD2533785.1 hypothetical protein [Nostoc flagelliforme FACHB-838]MCW5318417.1 hypothetical protein [Nostoc sp. KVJ3]OYD99891.1 hypothetical protein CDG79_38255 [Nostoc sp. 'Peltigera membranacea cyanobiont' 232]